MKFRDFFKKRKVETGLSQYTMGELEALKSIYESQLEEFDSPMSYDFHDVNLGSDFCVSAFDGNAHIKNQIQRDLADVMAEIHKRKSEPEKEREA